MMRAVWTMMCEWCYKMCIQSSAMDLLWLTNNLHQGHGTWETSPSWQSKQVKYSEIVILMKISVNNCRLNLSRSWWSRKLIWKQFIGICDSTIHNSISTITNLLSDNQDIMNIYQIWQWCFPNIQSSSDNVCSCANVLILTASLARKERDSVWPSVTRVQRQVATAETSDEDF